jgi:hypothetical protein
MSEAKTDKVITDWCSGICWQPRGHQSACDPPAKEVPFGPAKDVPFVKISDADLRAVYGEPCANPDDCPACVAFRLQ